MQTLKVEVTDEHLEKVSRTKPTDALLELIWNAVDSDASRVEVVFETGVGGKGVQEITIRDTGTGISLEDATLFFGRLGQSWKKVAEYSREQKRVLHGKEGEGRFKAFSLGSEVIWRSVYEVKGKRFRITIKSSPVSKSDFLVSDTPEETTDARGTTVVIGNIREANNELLAPSASDVLAEALAPYLIMYPAVQIIYNGRVIDVRSAISREHRVLLPTMPDLEGNAEQPELRIYEWNRNRTKREIHLCDPGGLSLASRLPWFHTTGFEFSAYILSRRIRQLHDANRLLIYEMEKSLDDLFDATRKAIKQYHLERKADGARSHIARLKSEGIYPYAGEPSDAVDTARRQLFDVLAVNIAEHHPTFDHSDSAARKLSYRFIRQAIEENPEAIQSIIAQVIDLPKETQNDLAELLQSTSMAAIVHASKTVADRVKFIAGLESLLFDPDLKPHFKERKQLHRLIAHETWILGEQYNLAASDRGLTEVLRKHRQLIQPDALIDDDPVRTDDGSVGIVDLMLSRTIPQPNAQRHEHLIIELKRPAVPIGDEAKAQAKKYANAIVDDERFKDTNTTWEFWLLSNELTRDIEDECNQRDRPHGLLYDDGQGRYRIWAKRWSSVLDDAKARLRHYKERLDLEFSAADGLAHLRRLYEKHIPISKVDALLASDQPGTKSVGGSSSIASP